jgi:uncharacterized protein (DUF983 family)
MPKSQLPKETVTEGDRCPNCKHGTMFVGYAKYHEDSGMYGGTELSCSLCGFAFTPAQV